MNTRTAPIVLGDITLTATYEVIGCHCPATMWDPEEWPEIELRQLATPGGEDISGLLEFVPVYERVLERVTAYERDTVRGPDPDAEYERRRDERMELGL